MAVREALLALLAQQDMYGYQLRNEFERRTGATWPLNAGQVYTTLARLERDGLVEEVPQSRSTSGGTVRYRITEAGSAAAQAWLGEPVSAAPERDELPIKVAIALTLPGVDVRALLQRQRTASLRLLQDYTHAKEQASDAHDTGHAPGDLAWLLVVESLIFRVESQIRWLDHCEARVIRASVDAGSAQPAVADTGSAPPAAADELQDDRAGTSTG